MEQHAQAWELIQKRQTLLDDLKTQVESCQAQLKQLTDEIQQMSHTRAALVKDLVARAKASLEVDETQLLHKKEFLWFEITELEKQQETLTKNLSSNWSEHDRLIKIVNTLAQEVSQLTAEAKAQRSRTLATLNDLDIKTKDAKAKKEAMDEALKQAREDFNILQLKIHDGEQLLSQRERAISESQDQLTQCQLQLERYKVSLQDMYQKLYDVTQKFEQTSLKSQGIDSTKKVPSNDEKLLRL